MPDTNDGQYYFDKKSCPSWCLCGGQGPLILLSCGSCAAIIACCGETDQYIGHYLAPRNQELERAIPEIVNYKCPKCGVGESLHAYATAKELARFGFSPEMVGQYLGAPEYFTECRTWVEA